MAFDRSKPYGEITGVFEDHPEARYVQDGKYFDGAGNEIVAEEIAPAASPAPKRGRPPKTAAVVNDVELDPSTPVPFGQILPVDQQGA